MVDYEYKFWESSQGLEEQQAEVFNEANEFKYKPANAVQIKQLYKKLKIDPKHVRYAFHGEKMVGYIQARIQKQVKEIVLSYPWTIKNTPEEVRKTLFNETINYFRDQGEFIDFQFRVNLFSKPDEHLIFLRSKGFVDKNIWKKLLLSSSEVADADYDSKYTSRTGSEKDIDALISLIKDDGSYASQYDTDEKLRKHLTEIILPNGHLIFILENEILTAASSPREAENCINLDFTVFKDVKDQSPFIPIFVEVARECVKSGYGNSKPLLVYTDNMDTPREEQEFLQQFTPVDSEIIMYYLYLDVND